MGQHSPARRSVFAALLAGGLLVACAGEAGDGLAAAHEALGAQDYFAARDHALVALRADPRDPQALEVLARAQLAMGQGEDALSSLERMALAGGKPADAGLLSAEAHLQRGDLARAEEFLLGQESAEAWRLRALIALLREDPEGAVAAFGRGREAPGEKVRLFAAEASFRLGRGEILAAREPVALARQAGPERVEALFVTGLLAQQEADAPLAASAFLAILERSPLDRPALLGAIEALEALQRVEPMRALVARGVAAYPADPDFLYLSGVLKAEEGNWAGVRDLFQQREGILPDHPPSRGLYAQALLELGQINLARSHLAPLYRQFPDDPQVMRVYARALLANGEHERAREVIAPLAALPDALPGDVHLAALAGSR